MRLLTVVGARPQFVKLAALSPVLRRTHEEVLLNTGQHYDSSLTEVFFRELDIPLPDYNLGVGSGTHAYQTAQMILGIEAAALDLRPNWMIVFGDTNSTLAAALVAAKLRLPLAHIEAGLRSYDRRMAEEVNRVVTDHMSDLCLCPTLRAVDNLAREAVVHGVHNVGDVMYDTYQMVHSRAASMEGVPDVFRVDPGRYVLVTIHRADNVDRRERLTAILGGLEKSGETCLFPAHPRTRKAIGHYGLACPANVSLVEPVGYLAMLALEKHARAIVTDSGGVQKEAYISGTPCITVRDSTEWPETVDCGWNTLIAADPSSIADAVASFRPGGRRPSLFGDGRASERIVAILESGGTVRSS